MKRLREFIRGLRRLARRSRSSVWDEDPINLQISKEMLNSECNGCEPCTGCPLIARCPSGGAFLEDLDNMGDGEW